MQLCVLVNYQVFVIGLGCMNFNYVYGQVLLEDDVIVLLYCVFEFGVWYFDIVVLYGFGGNEIFVGKVLKFLCKEFFFVSKCGMIGVDGKWVIDGCLEILQVIIDVVFKCL